MIFISDFQMFSKIPDDPNNNLEFVGEGSTTIVSASCPVLSIPPTTNSPTTNSSTSSSLMSPSSASSTNSSRPLTSPMVFHPPRPASAPCSNLYENRGTKRKSTAIMEEAINLMHKANEPLPPPPQEDDADIFGNLIATRLRGLEKEKRKQCENEILIILTRY